MRELVILHHPECLLHRPGEFHVERPERTESVLTVISENLKAGWKLRECSKAGKEDILLAHTEKHWNFINESILGGQDFLDQGDTYACSDSLNAALRAAGSVIDAVDIVREDNSKRVFCCVRPPGHHAESGRVMGFCLFNNIAVGARYAITRKGFSKILIIDWDVHHGNGTQEIFYDDPSAYFISLHQHPLYPGTGMKYETGEGPGKGYTKNFPMNPGTGGEQYQAIFNGEITQIIRDFRPELIMISAGFDAHQDDPLADIRLKESDYYQMTKTICGLAGEGNIPVISVLEGGYNLNALSGSVIAHLDGLSGL